MQSGDLCLAVPRANSAAPALHRILANESSSSSFFKTSSRSLVVVSPSGEKKLATSSEDNSRTDSAQLSQQKSGETPRSSTPPSQHDRPHDRRKSLDESLADLKRKGSLVGPPKGRTAKERKRLRSFTTSGTVTDIVAQMELEEGDPLLKEIATVVRRSELKLKADIRARHREFVDSVHNEIANVLAGVFAAQTSGLHHNTSETERLVTLGVQNNGATDEATNETVETMHQLDSLLSMEMGVGMEMDVDMNMETNIGIEKNRAIDSGVVAPKSTAKMSPNPLQDRGSLACTVQRRPPAGSEEGVELTEL